MTCGDLAFTAQALAWALAATIGALVICLAIIGRVTLRRAARHPLALRGEDIDPEAFAAINTPDHVRLSARRIRAIDTARRLSGDPMAAPHGDVPFRAGATPIDLRRVPRFPR